MSDADVTGPPREYAKLRELLITRRSTLPKRLAQVATYAMANPDDVAFGTVAAIAEKAQVQPSALVRFSQAIGYQGFTDLQAVFRDRLRDRMSSYDERLKALRAEAEDASRTAALLAGFCGAATRSIGALADRVDPQTVDAAARRLARAETVYLIAQRRSYPITAYMAYAFGKLGVKTVLVGSGAGTDPEMLAFAGPRDAALAVSFTPYASATVGWARQVASAGTPMVLITDSPFSPLLRDDAVWFEVVEADYQGFRSLSATMALAMTLTVAVAELRQGGDAANGMQIPD